MQLGVGDYQFCLLVVFVQYVWGYVYCVQCWECCLFEGVEVFYVVGVIEVGVLKFVQVEKEVVYVVLMEFVQLCLFVLGFFVLEFLWFVL